MGLRHDAALCRTIQRSEQIRVSLGIETPEEKTKREAREAEAAKAAAKKATLGTALFEEE